MARYLGVDVTNKDEYFFISYNSEDADRVSQYLMAMSEKGLPMWYDYGIEVGDKWSSIIADKIANSKAVIMFLSRQIFSKEESFVHKEWEMARDFFDKKIYVVILDDISKKEVPHRYVSWWIDVNHMQCIMASNYTVDSCADKIISATGYNVISNEETLSQRKPYAVEETNTEEDNKLDIQECVNETKEQNVNTQNGSNDINESKSDDFIIEAGVLKKYKGNDSVVRIPSGVTQIGENAFRGCRFLTEIVIPDSVTSIGGRAFFGCESLTKIVIPDGVTSIGEFAFYECKSLANVMIPNSVTSIGSAAFEDCSSLANIEIPNGIKSIESFVFNGCTSLANVIIPNSVTSIGIYAFNNCTSLTKIKIPNSVISIGEKAFYNCASLTNIEISNSITIVSKGTFGGCTSLASVIIPYGVKSVDKDAFIGCTSLTSVVIPDSVTSIGEYSFWNCNLKVIKYRGTKSKWFFVKKNKGWIESYRDYIINFEK